MLIIEDSKINAFLLWNHYAISFKTLVLDLFISREVLILFLLIRDFEEWHILNEDILEAEEAWLLIGVHAQEDLFNDQHDCLTCFWILAEKFSNCVGASCFADPDSWNLRVVFCWRYLCQKIFFKFFWIVACLYPSPMINLFVFKSHNLWPDVLFNLKLNFLVLS